MPDIHVMRDEDGGELLVTPVRTGMRLNDFLDIWERLEEVRVNGYEVCTVCSKAVPKDERGDVLDSSGRCDECRP